MGGGDACARSWTSAEARWGSGKVGREAWGLEGRGEWRGSGERDRGQADEGEGKEVQERSRIFCKRKERKPAKGLEKGTLLLT